MEIHNAEQRPVAAEAVEQHDGVQHGCERITGPSCL
jgi:hypothetical protein